MSQNNSNSPSLVRDLMTVGVPTCPQHTPAVELTQLMLHNDIEAVIVLDGQGHAAGVVSWDELVRAYTLPDFDQLAVEAIMRPEVPQVPPDIPLTAAAQIMQDLKTRVLFMTHHAAGIVYPAAMLTYRHLLRHLAMEDTSDLRDLGIKAARKSPVELFTERRDAARQRAGLGK